MNTDELYRRKNLNDRQLYRFISFNCFKEIEEIMFFVLLKTRA